MQNGAFWEISPRSGPANFDEKVFDSEFDEIVRVTSYRGAKYTVAILGWSASTTPSSELMQNWPFWEKNSQVRTCESMLMRTVFGLELDEIVSVASYRGTKHMVAK